MTHEHDGGGGDKEDLKDLKKTNQQVSGWGGAMGSQSQAHDRGGVVGGAAADGVTPNHTLSLLRPCLPAAACRPRSGVSEVPTHPRITADGRQAAAFLSPLLLHIKSWAILRSCPAFFWLRQAALISHGRSLSLVLPFSCCFGARGTILMSHARSSPLILTDGCRTRSTCGRPSE